MNETTVKSKLSRKDVFWSYVYWMMFALSCQNMERMEAPAFAGVMGKMADKLYNKIEDKQALMLRHTQFYKQCWLRESDRNPLRYSNQTECWNLPEINRP